jgi:glycosyltransferase involved in cell wall biosynthesis
MNIGYDHQIFSGQIYGGISRYFVELIRHMKNDPDCMIHLPIAISNNAYLNRSVVGANYVKLPPRIFAFRSKLFHKVNDLYCAYAKRAPVDIYHPTYYRSLFFKNSGNQPFVITIHDMIHEKYPELFPETDKVAIKKKELAKSAAAIIAVSKSTKEDIINILDIDERKVHVVYHGYFTIDSRRAATRFSHPYLLFVGNRDGYKNFSTLLHAFALVLKDHPDLKLVCFGGGKFSRRETTAIQRLGATNDVIQATGSDHDLVNYYRRARMFIFPSLYEGFGMPILESCANDCPVVCSEIKPFREVAGRAALFFAPDSIASIHNAISTVLESSVVRKDLIKAGQMNLERFSWEKSALETKNVYRSILQ